MTSSSVTLTAEDKTDDGYRSTLNLPAAEMTCDITVKVTIDGKTVEIKTFNIKDYTDTILTDEEFAVAYIASENEKEKDGTERLGHRKGSKNTG